MNTKALTLIVALSAVSGCATSSYRPGSPEAAALAEHRTLMNECMASRTDEIIEMAAIDPTYIYRSCRQLANSRVPHPGPARR